MIKLFGRNKHEMNSPKKEPTEITLPVTGREGLLNSSVSLTQRLADLFFVLAILFGLMLILLEPPYVCPDENVHYINVCRISRGSLFANVVDGKLGCYLSDEEFDFLNRFGGIYNGQTNPLRFDYSTMKSIIERPASNNLIFVETSYSSLNPTPYLLASLSVAIFRWLSGGLNAYSVLLIAKMTNLLFYAIVIRWALKKTPVFQNTMFLLALMPMSLFQGASVSYDALLIPAAFLLFAYAAKLLCTPSDEQITREDVIAICFACTFLFGAKIAYAPLILILLAICLKKFGGWKQWGICVGLVGAVGILIFLIPSLINGVLTRDIPQTVSDAQIAQNAYMAANLHRFPRVVLRTVEHFGAYWISSFVGILGWLDTPFPLPFVILFLIISTFNALMDMCSIKGIRWNARILSLCGVLVFFVGTIWAMFTLWNPVVGIVGGDIAYGVQGRYFIPVALFVLLAGANNLLDHIPAKNKLENFRFGLIRLTAVAFCSLTVLLVLVRYWAA